MRIYAYTVVGRDAQTWTRDVGDATVSGIGLVKVGETTKPTARERIHQQLGTAYPGLQGVTILLDENATRVDGTTFRDYDVHRALQGAGIRRVGGEWFEATLDEVRAAIASVRAGKTYASGRTQTFQPRPEQQEAIEITAAYFREHAGESQPPRFLWNAKMRFGKTFTAYELAREMEWTKVLVLTYKPAVRAAWEEDLTSHVDFEGWRFVGAETPEQESASIADGGDPFVWFASFQDLNSPEVKSRNEALYLIEWDAIVIDEYHFGAWRDGARDLYDPTDRRLALEEEPDDIVTAEDIGMSAHNYLFLSGTPFRALTDGEFSEDAVYNWTYIDEQAAKAALPLDRHNPYRSLPGMEMYMYRMSAAAEAVADDGEFDGFNLNTFFRAKRVGRNGGEFEDPESVRDFLDMLRGKLSEQMKAALLSRSRAAFPYEAIEFAPAVKHSIWYLPDVASCFAMRDMLAAHPYFRDFGVHVAAGTGAGNGADAKPPVDELIHDVESTGKSGSITLSCGKLLTGVTVKQWGAIFMLRTLKAPESYFQAAFRVQSPWVRDGEVQKDTCYVFEFDPNRALTLLAEYGTRLATGTGMTSTEALGQLINFLPIYAYDGGSLDRLDENEVMDWATAGIGTAALVSRWKSASLIDLNLITLERLLDSPELLASLEQMEVFRSLTEDVQKVITSTKKLKEVKREKGMKKLDPDEKKEQTETAKQRASIREKLQQFVQRVPVFMYLTDFREEALMHVIRSLDTRLFERVTGLTLEDFEMLAKIGVFNEAHMNASIYQFRRFEEASLRYASEKAGAGETRSIGRFTDVVKAAVDG